MKAEFVSAAQKKWRWGKNPQISRWNITTSNLEFVTDVKNGICVKDLCAWLKFSRMNAKNYTFSDIQATVFTK